MAMTELRDHIILYNIIPRLPTETLIRFRCVCKSWKSFICNPSFIHLRTLTNSNNITHLLFFTYDRSTSDGSSHPIVFSTPLNPNNTITSPCPTYSRRFTFPDLNFANTRFQCVNGLLCFDLKRVIDRFSQVNDFTVVANPTTKQIVKLPIDHSLTRDKKFVLSNHFGYDPVRDEFKVLRFVKYSDGSHEINIFTVCVDTSWRIVIAETHSVPSLVTWIHGYDSRRYKRKSLCVNGAIYWRNSNALVLFDVRTEQFRQMPTPSGYSYTEGNNVTILKHPDLMEIDNCLCLIGYTYNGFKLWILRDKQAQLWEQKNVVIPFEFLPLRIAVYPLCRVQTGEILILPYYLPCYVIGIYYDMDTMSSRKNLLMKMSQRWWTNNILRDVNIVYCQESFRILKQHMDTKDFQRHNNL